MKEARTLLLTVFAFWASACGSSQGASSGPGSIPVNLSLPNTAGPYLNATGSNILKITVGDPNSLCGKSGYPNEVCASITLCVPGTQQCQTISDLLVDTGSSGIRVFSSAVTLPLPRLKAPDGQGLAECAQFGIGSDWGPLAEADVVLGGEPAVRTPIQLIDRGYTALPKECLDADESPSQAGFNGILGVGLFQQDCGQLCASSTAVRAYFSCSETPPSPGSPSSECKPITLPLAQQLQNPVGLLPVNNNGVLMALPAVESSGATTVTGILALGIGTQPNNTPQGINAYFADARGNFEATLNGKSFPDSFIDSGSNGIFFPNQFSIPPCPRSSDANGFYCPPSPLDFTAFVVSNSGATQAQIPFQIADALALISSSARAFNNLGGTASDQLDLGLPFFYGRAVFVGIEQKSSTLGSGPLLGY